MPRRRINSVFAAILITGCVALPVHAETPSTRSHSSRSRAMSEGMPTRGMSMAAVRRRFGAPQTVLSKAGGDTHRHPTINRWRYADYTVYFERSRVIHSVRDGAAAPPRG